ncbi:MAG: hypothetical protein WD988_01270 [Candidatus Curtissbacteria bacterium]
MGKFKLVLAVASIIILSGCSSTKLNSSSTAPSPQVQVQEKVDFQASFEIYTDGLKRNFSNPKYHNKSEDVFITAEDPSIIHVKRSEIKWGDFFDTLPMKLEKECLTTGDGERLCNSQTKTLKFYVNNVENPNFLNEKIKSGDKARITYGNETPNALP